MQRHLLTIIITLLVAIITGVQPAQADNARRALMRKITLLQEPPSRADEWVTQTIDLAALEAEFPGQLTAMTETLELSRAEDAAGNTYNTIWVIKNGEARPADDFAGSLFKFTDCKVELANGAKMYAGPATHGSGLIDLNNVNFELSGGELFSLPQHAVGQFPDGSSYGNLELLTAKGSTLQLDYGGGIYGVVQAVSSVLYHDAYINHDGGSKIGWISIGQPVIAKTANRGVQSRVPNYFDSRVQYTTNRKLVLDNHDYYFGAVVGHTQIAKISCWNVPEYMMIFVNSALQNDVEIVPTSSKPFDGMCIATGFIFDLYLNYSENLSDGVTGRQYHLTQEDVEKIHFIPRDGSRPEDWEVYLDGEYARVRHKGSALSDIITSSEDLQAWIDKINAGEVTTTPENPLELKVEDGASFDAPVTIPRGSHIKLIAQHTTAVKTATVNATITVDGSLELYDCYLNLADIAAFKVNGSMTVTHGKLNIPDNITTEAIFDFGHGAYFEWINATADIPSDVMPDNHCLFRLSGDEVFFNVQSGTIEGNLYSMDVSRVHIGHPNQQIGFLGKIYIGGGVFETYRANFFGSQLTLCDVTCAYFDNVQNLSLTSLLKNRTRETEILLSNPEYNLFDKISLYGTKLYVFDEFFDPSVSNIYDVDVDCRDITDEPFAIVSGYQPKELNLPFSSYVPKSSFTMTEAYYKLFKFNPLNNDKARVAWDDTKKAGIISTSIVDPRVVHNSQELQAWINKVLQGKVEASGDNPLTLYLADGATFSQEVNFAGVKYPGYSIDLIGEQVLNGGKRARINMSSRWNISDFMYVEISSVDVDVAVTGTNAFYVKDSSLRIMYCNLYGHTQRNQHDIIRTDESFFYWHQSHFYQPEGYKYDSNAANVIHTCRSKPHGQYELDCTTIDSGVITGNVFVEGYTGTEKTINSSQIFNVIIEEGHFKMGSPSNRSTTLNVVYAKIPLMIVYGKCFFSSTADVVQNIGGTLAIGDYCYINDKIQTTINNPVYLTGALSESRQLPIEFKIESSNSPVSRFYVSGLPSNAFPESTFYKPYTMTRSDYSNIKGSFDCYNPTLKYALKWNANQSCAIIGKQSLKDWIERLQDQGDKGTKEDPLELMLDEDETLDEDLDLGDLHAKIVHIDTDVNNRDNNPTLNLRDKLIRISGGGSLTVENVNIDGSGTIPASNSFVVDYGTVNIKNSNIGTGVETLITLEDGAEASLEDVHFKADSPYGSERIMVNGGSLRVGNGTYYGIMAQRSGSINLRGTTSYRNGKRVYHLNWMQAMLRQIERRGTITASQLYMRRNIGGRMVRARGGRSCFRHARFGRIRGRADEVVNPDTTMILTDNVIELDGNVEEMPSVALEGPDAGIELGSALQSEFVVVFNPTNSDTGEKAERVVLMKGIPGEYMLSEADLQYVKIYGPTDWSASWDKENNCIVAEAKSGIGSVVADDLNRNYSLGQPMPDDELFDIEGHRVGSVADIDALPSGIYLTRRGHKFLKR